MSEDKGTNSAGLWTLYSISGSIVAISLISAPFLLIPASRRLGSLPWMATPRSVIKQAIESIHIKSKHSRPKWIDLGSGDGRVCIAAAKAGYHATGVELNPLLVILSYYNAVKEGVSLQHINFTVKNFWSMSIADYQIVSVFGVKSIMERLDKKIVKEGEKGLQIVCFRFEIPNRKVVKKIGELYFYEH